MKIVTFIFLFFVLSESTALAQSTSLGVSGAEEVPLGGTSSLRVVLPPGWQSAPAKPPNGSNSSTAVRYSGDPSFQILAMENVLTDKSPRLPNTNLPFDCRTLFAVMALTKNAQNENLSVFEARPDYVPDSYYARVLVAEPISKHVAEFVCLDRGFSTLVLQISPIPEAADGSKVTPGTPR